MIKRKKTRFRARRSLGSIVLTTATFLAFLGIVWQAYQSDVTSQAEQKALPIIQSYKTPEKVRPKNEGGMEFANQDVSIFEQIEEPFAGKSRRLERLSFFQEQQKEEALPEVAELDAVSTSYRVIPFARDVEEKTTTNTLPSIVSSTPETDSVAVIETASGEEELVKEEQKAVIANKLKEMMSDTIATKEAIVVEEAPILDEQAQEKIDLALAILDKPKEKEVEKKSAPTGANVQKIYLGSSARNIEKEVNSNAPQTLTTGGYTIQLGSVRSADSARQEWQKIQNRLPMLIGLPLNVEEADLGARGMFYRIQAGSLNKSDADRICGEIKANSGDCLVKKK